MYYCTANPVFFVLNRRLLFGKLLLFIAPLLAILDLWAEAWLSDLFFTSFEIFLGNLVIFSWDYLNSLFCKILERLFSFEIVRNILSSHVFNWTSSDVASKLYHSWPPLSDVYDVEWLPQKEVKVGKKNFIIVKTRTTIGTECF